MGQPYVGEIRMFAGNFAPAGWMLCEGQQLAIAENETLFQLIGTTYGGDGQETFNLPNLASCIPLHMGTGPDGTNYQIAEMAGVEQVTLTVQQMPLHNHPMLASSSLASSPDPLGAVLAQSRTAGVDLYLEDTPNSALAASSVGATGGSQPHTNMQPYLCINFIISLYGIFPSPT